MRALEALERINKERGANIAFSWSCREWHCGSCGVLINGVPTLLCRQEIFDGDLIEPLPLPVMKDLVVDRETLSNLSIKMYEKVGAFGDSSLLTEKDTELLKRLDICMDCDVCYVSCPYFSVDEKKFVGSEHMVDTARFVFDPRVDKEKSLGIALEAGIWDCVTCMLCNARCPKKVNPMDWTIEMKRMLIETPRSKAVPPKIIDLNESLYKYGNPYGKPKDARGDWAKELNAKNLAEGEKAELLYFAGCAQCYEPRDQEAARAIVRILKNVNIDFGILGKEEICCGDVAKNTGEQGLCEELRKTNTETFEKYGVRKLITTSPHCYNAFKKDYYLKGIEAQHYTEFLAQLAAEGKLKFTKSVHKRVAYHDPCYLGRYNGVYDAPRFILSSIQGLELAEFSKNKENSLCCGGGGGGVFSEPLAKPRLSEIRVKQAQEVGAEMIAVACPFCRTMLEDAVKDLELDMEVKHVAEVVSEAMGL